MNKYVWRNGGAAIVGVTFAFALAGCDGGSATAPARDHARLNGAASSATPSYGGGRGGYDRGGYSADAAGQPDHRKDTVPLFKGKPMWAANRLHSAEENAQYHFERDGADFDAKTVQDYVGKAHAFVDKPPADVQTLTRTNGDRLLYDAKRNIFAVVSKQGAPRTMFKPRDGAVYWAQQTEREAERTTRGDRGGGRQYGRRSGSDDGGEG
jgi:hypothetical protein